MIKFLLSFLLFPTTLILYSQDQPVAARRWADSVYKTLSKNERIAQLMIIRAHSNLTRQHVDAVTRLINKYNVGGLCFFQGGPVRQANLTNYYQSIARTPLMITIDGEWGLGMRLDSVINFQRQLMMGAVNDGGLIYRFGKAVGEQCRRLGIHVNFAPVVDINNNPNNPVINDRSFGEDKYKVSLFGIQYMKGLQDAGVMACAKHFPGHGDVSVDSHLDLPVINKSRAALDSLELYPFRQMIKEGVGSVMIAHLYIPAIDTTTNQATSLSYNNVTQLLKNELGFNGLTFTDALEMKGVTKFFPSGKASVQSLAAGNDMLCLPEDVKGSIKQIRKALRKHQLNRKDMEERVKKVLVAKYNLGLNHPAFIDTAGLISDLNRETRPIKAAIAENAITLLKAADATPFPLKGERFAYLGIGADQSNTFAKRLHNDLSADVYTFGFKELTGSAAALTATLKSKYDYVIIGIHNYSRRPANNFGLTAAAIALVDSVQKSVPTVTLVFGNPYAIKNFSASSTNLLACYEDDEITQNAAADVITGMIIPKGKLPVTVSNQLRFGSGITTNSYMPYDTTVIQKYPGLNLIDSIANDAIAKHATPGCVVLAAKGGKIAFHRAYGYMTYDSIEPVTNHTIFDLASVTKISATTVSVMKLYEEGRLDLNKTLGYYLPWTKGSNKEDLLIKDILLHQAGLVAWIPFYRSVIDKQGKPFSNLFSHSKSSTFPVRVADSLYMRGTYVDTMYQLILKSPLASKGKYVYSDNDFIFLGKIVEAITGQPLQDYVRQTFYMPLKMTSTSFLPREHFPLDAIAPTEEEKVFRRQLIRGDVHDPAAAMFGGVAGHAGLFSNAYDLAQLYQMLLNGGEMNGIRYLKKTTIDSFTAYSTEVSRRGLGFDKPEKDNLTRKEPYPSYSVSPLTYGHTGFTGICVWADPAFDLLYIFMSNRVMPDGENTKLSKLNVRSNIQEVIYKTLVQKPAEKPVTAAGN